MLSVSCGKMGEEKKFIFCTSLTLKIDPDS